LLLSEEVDKAIAENPDQLLDPHGQPETDDSERAVMFAEILQVGTVHLHVESRRGAIGAGSTIVNSFGFGIVCHAPAGIAKTLWPVDICAIHEELVVEDADFLESG